MIPILLDGAALDFHPDGPLVSEGKDVDCGSSADRCSVGELGRAFRDGCFDGFDGAGEMNYKDLSAAVQAYLSTDPVLTL